MIRTISTGDIGTDVILGGGWRLIERIPCRESATIILRGGPGTGKTLFATDVARCLATALNGDVVVACVELLPTEYLAQLESGRPELAKQTVIVTAESRPFQSESPRIFCALLPELTGDEPDLVSSIESLRKSISDLGGKPAAIVIDSLIAGYNLGPGTPRQNIDAVMKFAAQYGIGLIMCEESTGEVSSSWDFAADTVLELEHNRTTGRQIVVRKHRFGPSATGVHQLIITGWKQPMVAPDSNAWLGLSERSQILRHYGWTFLNGGRYSQLSWIRDLEPLTGAGVFTSALTLVSAPDVEVARKLACGLVPVAPVARRDFLIELDPIGTRRDRWLTENAAVCTVPLAIGAMAAVCEVIDFLGKMLFDELNPMRSSSYRILIGDLATTQGNKDADLWLDSIYAISLQVARSGWGIPVIVFDSSEVLALENSRNMLRARADMTVNITSTSDPTIDGHIQSRRDESSQTVQWRKNDLYGGWPPEISSLADSLALTSR